MNQFPIVSLVPDAIMEQIHRILKRMNNDMEADRHFSYKLSTRSGTMDYFTKLKTASLISMPS
jgi:hypothetical protein